MRYVPVLYLALVLAAILLAAARLSHSAELPGLAAIELVLLALPWSLALSIEPMSHLGWGEMVTIVLGGLLLNGVLICHLATWVLPPGCSGSGGVAERALDTGIR